jgi:hypothetical protein
MICVLKSKVAVPLRDRGCKRQPFKRRIPTGNVAISHGNPESEAEPMEQTTAIWLFR